MQNYRHKSEVIKCYLTSLTAYPSEFRNDWEVSEERTDKATFGCMECPPSILSLLPFILLLKVLCEFWMMGTYFSPRLL
jgi:hypothetical protein